ncbi:hypothetical protein [Cloacibacillus sp.]
MAQSGLNLLIVAIAIFIAVYTVKKIKELAEMRRFMIQDSGGGIPPLPDTAFDVWDGTFPTTDPFLSGPDADGWYIIDSASKMAAFTMKTNYQAYSGWTAFPMYDVKVKVTKNIDMNNKVTLPIGTRAYSKSNFGFTGYFDGQGHTIRNVNMISDSADSEVGFFCFVRKVDATPQGTIIKNFQLTGSITPTELTNYFGGVVGFAQDTKIQNVVSNISMVQDQNWASLMNVGGIAGAYVSNLTLDEVFNNCVVLNNIIVPVMYNPMNIGGIVGIFSGDNIINNCTFNGDEISVNDVEHTVGGICGLGDPASSIIECSAYAIQPQGSSSFGGIVGGGSIHVNSCYYSDGNDNGYGGTMVSATNVFPITSCILREYAYPANKNCWMKGTNYPKNVDLASNDIYIQIQDGTGTEIRTFSLPVQKQASDPEYTLVDLTGGVKGLANAPMSNANPATTVIEFKIGDGGGSNS